MLGNVTVYFPRDILLSDDVEINLHLNEIVYEGIERGWMNLIIQFEYQKHLSINILKGIRAWVRRKGESWSGESRRSSFLFFATFVIPRIARQKVGYVLGDGARLSQVPAYIPCHTYFMNKRSPQRRHKPRERES